jgi:hypothetical protein
VFHISILHSYYAQGLRAKIDYLTCSIAVSMSLLGLAIPVMLRRRGGRDQEISEQIRSRKGRESKGDKDRQRKERELTGLASGSYSIEWR